MSDATAGVFTVGQQVEALWAGRHWPATVLSVRDVAGHGSLNGYRYDIVYLDGTIQRNRLPSEIRPRHVSRQDHKDSEKGVTSTLGGGIEQWDDSSALRADSAQKDYSGAVGDFAVGFADVCDYYAAMMAQRQAAINVGELWEQLEQLIAVEANGRDLVHHTEEAERSALLEEAISEVVDSFGEEGVRSLMATPEMEGRDRSTSAPCGVEDSGYKSLYTALSADSTPSRGRQLELEPSPVPNLSGSGFRRRYLGHEQPHASSCSTALPDMPKLQGTTDWRRWPSPSDRHAVQQHQLDPLRTSVDRMHQGSAGPSPSRVHAASNDRAVVVAEEAPSVGPVADDGPQNAERPCPSPPLTDRRRRKRTPQRSQTPSTHIVPPPEPPVLYGPGTATTCCDHIMATPIVVL